MIGPAAPAAEARGAEAAVGAVGATNLAIAALTLVNGVLIARLLGPEGRGALFAMAASPTAAGALVGMLAHQALARRAASGLETRARLNGLALLATLPLAAVTAAVSVLLLALAGGRLEPAHARAALLYSVVWAPAAVALFNFQAVDMGGRRWARYNLLRLAPYPVILAGVTACAVLGVRDPPALLLVLLASTVAPFLARTALALREGGFARPAAGEVRALAGEAVPFASAGAGGAALAHADQLVAAAVLAPEAAGLYAVAQRAGLLFAPLASAVGAVAFAHAAASDRRPVARAYPAVLAVAALVLAPAVWALVPILFGEAFAGARPAAVLALGAGLLAALAEVREQATEGEGRPLRVLPARLAAASALGAAAVPAGLRAGAAGIAAACLLAQAVRLAVTAAMRERA
jgi:O-antigen/teichoic acid export membrane protein